MMDMKEYNKYAKEVLGPKSFTPEIFKELMEIEGK